MKIPGDAASPGEATWPGRETRGSSPGWPPYFLMTKAPSSCGGSRKSKAAIPDAASLPPSAGWVAGRRAGLLVPEAILETGLVGERAVCGATVVDVPAHGATEARRRRPRLGDAQGGVHEDQGSELDEALLENGSKSAIRDC